MKKTERPCSILPFWVGTWHITAKIIQITFSNLFANKHCYSLRLHYRFGRFGSTILLFFRSDELFRQLIRYDPLYNGSIVIDSIHVVL